MRKTAGQRSAPALVGGSVIVDSGDRVQPLKPRTGGSADRRVFRLETADLAALCRVAARLSASLHAVVYHRPRNWRGWSSTMYGLSAKNNNWLRPERSKSSTRPGGIPGKSAH